MNPVRTPAGAIAAALVSLAAISVATYLLANARPPDPGAGDPGVEAARVTGRRYAEALGRGDATALSEILHASAESHEVQARIQRYAGLDFHDAEVQVVSEFPRIYRLLILGRAPDGSPVPIAEVIEWSNGGWDFAPFATPPPGT